MVRGQLFVGAALLAGVAVGYFAGGYGSDAASAAAEPEVRRAPKAAIADRGDEAAVKALRLRVAELEKALEERGEAGAAKAADAAERPEPAPEAPRPANPREWAENFRKRDPEGFARMTNRVARWRQQRTERAQSAISFLSSIDTSGMGAAQRKVHAEFQDVIARREEIEAQIQREDLSWEERGKLMQEMFASHHEMSRLAAEERRNLLDATAQALGLAGDDAAEFSSTVDEIYKSTDSGFHMPHEGRGHRGGRGGR